MPIPLSDPDKRTVQLAAHGVVALMASSRPGALSAPRAGIAAAKALSAATGLTGQVLAEKPRRLPFRGSVADIAAIVLPALAAAGEILDRAQPGEAENFRRTIRMVAESAARAGHRGPTPAETEMMRTIQAALLR